MNHTIGRRFDSRGRPQYTRRSTQSEIDRRDGWIAKFYRRGHSVLEIATTLDVNRHTVTNRLNEMGLYKNRRVKGRGPISEPCPWRDEDVPAEERFTPVSPEMQTTRWRQSRIIGQAQMLNDEYRESNFANVLANQASDAEEAGDKDWLIEALATVNAAIEKLTRARRVLADDSYRALCRDTLEGVEGMRHKQPRHPALRAVPR